MEITRWAITSKTGQQIVVEFQLSNGAGSERGKLFLDFRLNKVFVSNKAHEEFVAERAMEEMLSIREDVLSRIKEIAIKMAETKGEQGKNLLMGEVFLREGIKMAQERLPQTKDEALEDLIHGLITIMPPDVRAFVENNSPEELLERSLTLFPKKIREEICRGAWCVAVCNKKIDEFIQRITNHDSPIK